MSRQKQEISEEIKSQILELFLNEGETFKVIAEKTGLAATKVSSLIKEWDIVDPRKTILAKFPTKDSDQDRNMLAAQVYRKFPEYEFWQRMRLPFELNSLKWFLGEDGEDYILSYIREFKTPAPERKTVEISPQKIGEDYVINKKITRKDFLS